MRTSIILMMAVLCLIPFMAYSQTIATGPVSGSAFCPGTPLSVSFEAEGKFQAGNNFTLQISSADGSFNSFRNFGYLNGTASGTINAALPEDNPPGKHKL